MSAPDIDPHQLLNTAADLLSEDGENVEYDRAIVELTSDLLGLTQDDHAGMADLLRTKREIRHAITS